MALRRNRLPATEEELKVHRMAVQPGAFALTHKRVSPFATNCHFIASYI
jgi:hypothetical protein